MLCGDGQLKHVQRLTNINLFREKRSVETRRLFELHFIVIYLRRLVEQGERIHFVDQTFKRVMSCITKRKFNYSVAWEVKKNDIVLHIPDGKITPGGSYKTCFQLISFSSSQAHPEIEFIIRLKHTSICLFYLSIWVYKQRNGELIGVVCLQAFRGPKT